MDKNPKRSPVLHRLAALFGSQAEVARIVGRDKSTVARWTSVPSQHHRRLLEEASARRIPLRHSDLVV
jgi:hypothetical protein